MSLSVKKQRRVIGTSSPNIKKKCANQKPIFTILKSNLIWVYKPIHPNFPIEPRGMCAGVHTYIWNQAWYLFSKTNYALLSQNQFYTWFKYFLHNLRSCSKDTFQNDLITSFQVDKTRRERLICVFKWSQGTMHN